MTAPTTTPRPTKGLIVGFDDCTPEMADNIRRQLEQRFPGVAFAVMNRSCQPIAFDLPAEPTDNDPPPPPRDPPPNRAERVYPTFGWNTR